MTIQELVSKAKLRLRKSSNDDLDQDVGQLVAVALADLKRIGVHESYLSSGSISDPLIIEAALIYVNANFGSPENYGDLMECYNMILTKIKGGGYHRCASEAAG